jgi:hypothetical protein
VPGCLEQGRPLVMPLEAPPRREPWR